jgi:starch phosphorylase
MALGRIRPDDHSEPFCMTVLGLRLSRRRNAVSALHAETSRRMWKTVWPGPEESDVPIGHITNGVHVKSWLAPSMARLYVRHLGKAWETRMSFYEFWQDIEKVSDTELWEEHQVLRDRLIRFVRRRLALRLARLHGTDPTHVTVDALGAGVLTIGFSRRFATYKRATLVLSDLDRLDAILNHPERPAQIIFAGKAHPQDHEGKRLIQHIFELMRDSRFRTRIAFIEDYDMWVARHLVQGVDLWLNTPERPKEACGTSGQKVLLNGGLNCSILDGWWAEAADGLNGFTIGDGREHADPAVQRERDAEALYRVLEEQAVPEFYDRNDHGVPVRWVRRMKHAIKMLGWRFNSDRMVKDYLLELYLPAAGGKSCAFEGRHAS